MKLKLLASTIALWVSCPSQAAVVYEATLTGTLTKKTNEGTDPGVLSVGDELLIRASFDDRNLIDWGDSGYKIAFFYGGAGPSNFSLTFGPYSLGAGAEIWDGSPVSGYRRDFYTLTEEGGFLDWSFQIFGRPALIMKDGKVAGVTGWLVPASGTTPQVELGSSAWGYTDCERVEVGPYSCTSYFGTPSNSQMFSVGGYPLYNNRYSGPWFEGTWDFENSVTNVPFPVTAAVPEPTTWLTLIVGFFVIGSTLRASHVPIQPARSER